MSTRPARLARALTSLALVVAPAIASAQPVRATFTSETPAIPGNQAGDTAVLRDPWGLWRDLVFGGDAVNNGFYGFLVDGGTAVTTTFGSMGGVDARPPLAALPSSTPGGLVAISATTAGLVLFHTTHPDGGFPGVGNVPVVTPRALALADFGDAGAFVFLDTGGPNLLRLRLREDGGAVGTTPEPSITLPFTARALATSTGLRRVYASVGVGGVVEIAPLESPPTVVNVIDAGFAPSEIVGGLAVYPQRDGGALLVTSVPALDLFRVYEARPGQARHLADFTITASDGGRKIVGAEFIDAWPGAFGVTDAGPRFDAGVLVVCDRLSPSGANYKLVPWDSLARATMPPLPIDLPDLVEVPITPPPPSPLPFALAQPFSAPAADVAFWPGRDSLLAVFDGVTRLSNADLRALESTPVDAGPARAVDGMGAVAWAPLGLSVSAHPGGDGGTMRVWTTGADGGLVLVASVAASARSVALADFADAGLRLFAAEDASVRQFVLAPGDGGVTSTALAELLAPGPVTSLAAAPGRRRLVVATSTGVFELDPLGGTPARALVDGGAPALALYPQADGGALLLTIDSSGERFHVYELGDMGALAERFAFELGPGDGGRLTGAIALDVTPGRAGLLPDGGATWPSGVLAISAAPDGGSTLVLVPWNTLATAATPPLPIDVPTQAGGAGGGGGGSGGGTNIPIAGGRGGGGTGGGGEEPPPGCCNGAPSAALIPTLAFLIWLGGFRRRRPARSTDVPR